MWAEQKQQEFYTLEGNSKGINTSKKTLKDLLETYGSEVSIKKKGYRAERTRLQRLSRKSFAELQLLEINKQHIKAFIDDALKNVKTSTVNRDLSVLSSVFSYAIEIGLCTDNPIKQVKKPKNPKPRDRRISENEMSKILWCLDFDEKNLQYPLIGKHEIAIGFLIAIETAMRQGEIWGLAWDDVFLDQSFVRLHDTKNGSKRDVALSARAVELFKLFKRENKMVFSVRQNSAGTIFRRAVKLAGIEDLTFHDTRHEALTRLAQKLEVLDLARMVGHHDPRSLMIYYNATATEIAGRLG